MLESAAAELEGFAVRAQRRRNDDSINGRLLQEGKDKNEVRHAFRIPARHILTDEDLARFQSSRGHELVVAFVFGLADSVRGKPVSWVMEEEEKKDKGKEDVGLRTVRTVARILGAIEKLVEETPREEEEEVGEGGGNNGVSVLSSSTSSSSRFGNKAFRTFLTRLEGRVDEWHDDWLGLGIELESGGEPEIGERNGHGRVTATDEVSTYLLHAFGSGARLDYGSGHELNFILWLLCLNRLHLLPQSPSLNTAPASVPSNASSSSSAAEKSVPTFPLIALHLFPLYLRLARLIQSTYYLEPAGSHGVWGLDDHQFLPFLFGAAQLVGHPILTPRSVHNDLLLEEYGGEYLYLDQIAYVNSVKTVVKGLRWHSPMLDDISAAKSWAKVEKGMRLMFLKEVLGKVPVMQHFLGGSLIELGHGPDSAEDKEEELGGGSGEMTMKGEKFDSTSAVPLHPSDRKQQQHHDSSNSSSTAFDDHNNHTHSGWGDCCGIRIPSSVGALQEMRKRMGGERGLRRIPFD